MNGSTKIDYHHTPPKKYQLAAYKAKSKIGVKIIKDISKTLSNLDNRGGIQRETQRESQ